MYGEKLQRLFNRVPIVIEYEEERHKLLVPHDWPLAMVVGKLRHKLLLADHESLFVLAGNRMLPMYITADDAHTQYRNEEGILVLQVKKENVFG